MALAKYVKARQFEAVIAPDGTINTSAHLAFDVFVADDTDPELTPIGGIDTHRTTFDLTPDQASQIQNIIASVPVPQ